MHFLARLLLSLSCAAAVLSPAAATDMAADMAAVADEAALHCQHQDPADHAVHDGGHAAGSTAHEPGHCDDCGGCASHCLPVLIGTPGHLPAGAGNVQRGAPPLRLAGISAAPELKPPRG